jgi:thiamine biosynthesis lipoprotein
LVRDLVGAPPWATATLCMVAALAGCSRTPELRSFTGDTMGTTYHVTVARGGRQADVKAARACIDSVLAEVDRELSTYRGDSEITAFNRNASTDWIPISEPLYRVIETAARVSSESGGAFDVTVAPLVRLWGFGAGASNSDETPGPEFVHDAQASVGYRWLEIRHEPSTAARKERAPLELDVDGIAPGYAVDRISACLSSHRMGDHLVELGGEVRANGHRADGKSWQIAIEAPVTGVREAYAGLQLTNLAVSTSGSYRDARRLQDGRVVSHTIDPRTGEPVSHGLVSVTVVHPRTIDADAYATAIMVLGPVEGLALARRLKLPVLLLERMQTAGHWREATTPEFESLRRPAQ